MKNNQLWKIILVAGSSILLTWLPFKLKVNRWAGIDFGRVGMERVVQNFDGINFLIVAKTGYNPEQITNNYQDMLAGRKPSYFAAHYPALPLLIKIFDSITTGPNALLIAIVAQNILLAVALYYFFLTLTTNKTTAFWLSIVSLFLPARMLADRMVGSNEPLFVFFVLSSLTSNYQKKYWISALWGVGAVMTRSPGILLFAAYAISTWYMVRGTWLDKAKALLPYSMIPLSLLALWIFYGYQFGSFWAYFQVGGNLNLYYPFAVFASGMDWVSGIWKDDIIYLFATIISGSYLFWKKYPRSGAAVFLMIYAGFIMCVAHRDLARYSLPIFPLLWLGMREVWESKLGSILMILLAIPTFMYAWQFVLANYQPIVDWGHYL